MYPRTIKKEIFHVLPVFFFFIISFTIINWIEALLFERMGFTPYHFLEVAIAAALIAKIVLVVNQLPIVNLFRRQPLIYSICWKTILYWVILLFVRLSIRFVPFFVADENHFSEDIRRFFHQMDWNVFISIQAYYLMLLFIFVTFQEVAFKIGPRKMRRMFFGR